MPNSFVNSMCISLAVLVSMLGKRVRGMYNVYSLAAEIDHGRGVIHPHAYAHA